MTNILSIETSTTVCSVALHSEGDLRSFSQYFIEKSHSSILTPLISETVSHSGLQMPDLSAVAISEGPGSYTGLRIGTSTAKGICFGLDIPLIAINTLLAMAAGVSKTVVDDSLLCPMLDARRMEVYSLVSDRDLNLVRKVEPQIIDENSFSEYLESNKVTFFGNGSDKCKTVIHSENARFIDDINPSAKEIGTLACAKFENQDFVDLAKFEPFYLKAFRAGKPKQLI